MIKINPVSYQNIYFKSAKPPINYPAAQIEHDSIKDEQMIGQVANSIVYSIPYSSDFCLKVLNKPDPNKIKSDEFPQGVNLGQPVWQDEDNPNILMLRRIKGEENSIPNWSKTIFDPQTGAPQSVTKEQAGIYLSKVRAIANMPQKSYNELAYKIKILEDRGYKLDSINPNNLIVNFDDNEINVIDYFKIPPYDIDKGVYKNCYLDIVSLALDFTLLPEYFDKLSKEEQDELADCIAKINSKAYLAAVSQGLSCNSEKFRNFIYYTIQWFEVQDNNEYIRKYEQRTEDFIKMLKNPWEWAQKRRG